MISFSEGKTRLPKRASNTRPLDPESLCRCATLAGLQLQHVQKAQALALTDTWNYKQGVVRSLILEPWRKMRGNFEYLRKRDASGMDKGGSPEYFRNWKASTAIIAKFSCSEKRKTKNMSIWVKVIFVAKPEHPARTTRSQRKSWSLKLVVVKFGPKG